MVRVLIALASLFGAIGLLGSVVSASSSAPCGGHCNVIFIVVDALSASDIATYGYDRDTMPQTTAFFEEHGQIFDDVTSGAAWTFPSFASMYFSDLPTDITFQDYEGQASRPQLFSALRAGGVTIRGIHLVNDPKNGNFILDAVYGLLRPDEHVNPESKHSIGEWRSTDYALIASAKTANALSSGDAPFFTFTHLLTVHTPYNPEPPYQELFASTTQPGAVSMGDVLAANLAPSVSSSTIERYRLRYDQSIAETDALLGHFLSSLSTTTLSNTAIIITADHGEAFYDHGHFFHGLSVYQSEAHVPLFTYVPGSAPRRVSEAVSLLDIAPTILSIEGAPVPSAFKGTSLLPLIRGSAFGPRLLEIENGYPFFLQRESLKPGVQAPITLKSAGALGSPLPIISLDDWAGRLGIYKLVMSEDDLRGSLYTMQTDPGEQHPRTLAELLQPQQLIYMRLLAAFLSIHRGR